MRPAWQSAIEWRLCGAQLNPADTLDRPAPPSLPRWWAYRTREAARAVATCLVCPNCHTPSGTGRESRSAGDPAGRFRTSIRAASTRASSRGFRDVAYARHVGSLALEGGICGLCI
jgi:hypothetical protein